MPKQSDFVSDLTLHTIIHNKQLNSKYKLDDFIDKHKNNGHLKFSTLEVCNEWTEKNQKVDYLDNLDCEKVLLFNEIEGLIYIGKEIKTKKQLKY